LHDGIAGALILLGTLLVSFAVKGGGQLVRGNGIIGRARIGFGR